MLLALLVPAAGAHADDALDTQALSAQGVAGDILDAALDHCRRGEQAQAMSMFHAIRGQLEPPPAILRLIDDLEATGCASQAPARGGVLRVQAGAGWDSNVSQGINARSLVLGSGDNTLELPLDESYRPRSSAYAQASVDYSLALPAIGVNLQLAAGHRKNTREPDFDLSTVSGSAGRVFEIGGVALRGQVDLAEIWLGKVHYQRTQGLALQWARPVDDGGWLVTASATRLNYLTQPTQNAMQWDLGVLREWRLNAATTLHAGISYQQDNAAGTRPGGDRQGFQLQAGALLLAQGWRFRPQISYIHWDSREVFAPGLIDVKRRNRLHYAALQAEKPLSARTSLVLEWRGRSARDTVALYRYNARSLTATLAHRF